MARTLDEITQAIRADFVSNYTLQEAYSLDADLTFDEQFSTVSLEAIITYIVAAAIWLMEKTFDDTVSEVEAEIAATYPFSKAWYYDQALAFQYGDSLEFDETTYKFSYPEIDESKQIVKYAAIRQREVSGVTYLQVFIAKENKEAVDEEMAAFTAYMKQIGAAGTHFAFISKAPDEIEMTLEITYDPQVLDYEGNRLSSSGKPVDEAVTSYLDTIKYSGAFNRTKLVDAIQLADGVTDVVLGDLLMNDGLQNSQTFESPSGFYLLDTINATYTPGYDY